MRDWNRPTRVGEVLDGTLDVLVCCFMAGFPIIFVLGVPAVCLWGLAFPEVAVEWAHADVGPWFAVAMVAGFVVMLGLGGLFILIFGIDAIPTSGDSY